ncbi:MAG: PHP domain-containing protein, partial [Candidatus Aminicenantales bacterium]
MRGRKSAMFVPLRIHSVYSRGRGSVTLEEAAGWAGGQRLPAVALADVGNIYGWGKWKRIVPAGGSKPIFGCELECGGRRFVFLVKTREGYSNLMEIFNRGEVRDASGLIAIYIPGREEGRGASEAAMLDELRGKVAPGDLYLGADFGNFRRILESVPDSLSGLPVVWANPLKYLTSPERLILLHAIEQKIPYPPERDRLLGRMKLFGPHQEALALRRFGDAAKDALARTAEVAEKCEFVFENVIPGLPADLFP